MPRRACSRSSIRATCSSSKRAGSRTARRSRRGRSGRERELLVDFNKRLAHPLAGSDADPQRARVRQRDARRSVRPSDVLIDDGRIVAVSAAGHTARKAGRTIDAGGRVLLPGLFDMHVHVGFWDGGLHLAAGRHHRARHGQRQRHAAADHRAGAGAARCWCRASCRPASSKARARMSRATASSSRISTRRRRRSTGTTSTAIRRSRSTTRSRRTSCRETTAYAHAKGMRVSGHVPAFLRAQDVGAGGLRRDPAHQPGAAQFPRRRQDRHAHAASASICRRRRSRTSTSTASRCRTSSRCWRSARSSIDPDAGHLRFHPPARRRDVAGVRGGRRPRAAGRAARLPARRR